MACHYKLCGRADLRNTCYILQMTTLEYRFNLVFLRFLKKKTILFIKQFSFPRRYSPNHPIVQLVHKIIDSFEKEQFILGIFIDLLKAFDTVDHFISLKKLRLYGITDKTIVYIESYLSNWKQYIHIGKKIQNRFFICYLWRLPRVYSWTTLFLVCVNNLPNASCSLDPIIIADDTNLFFNKRNIKHLLTVVNKEQVNIKDWFTANKTSLNVEKTKYSFYHKPSEKGDIPLRLPKLIINNYETQREESIKFFGQLLT